MRNIIIITIILLAATGSYIAWNSYNNNLAADNSCSDHCTEKDGNYSLKMSLMCEQSCAAKNVNESKVVLQSEAKVGDYTRCPVSGVVFNVTAQSPIVKYKEKIGYTCCGQCSGIFEKEPQEFISNL